MKRLAIAVFLFASARASTDASAPAVPGARAVQAWGAICPKDAPVRVDCNGDGVLDALIPAYHEGPFHYYLPPEVGVQFGLIGGAASMKAFTGNQNFTQAAALSGPDGKVMWTFTAGAMINVSRVVAGENRLYLASHDDILRALDLGSGKVLWQQNLKGNIVGLAGSREQILAVSTTNDIMAFRSGDGSLLWKKPMKTAVMKSPNFGFLLADDRLAYIAPLDNHVSALDRATGELRWDFKTSGNASLRLLTGGALLIAEGRDMIALEAATGRLRWKTGLGGWVHMEPVLDLGDRVAFLQPYGESKLMALDLRTGAVSWSVIFEPVPRDKDRKIVTPEDAAPLKSTIAVQNDAEGRPRLLFAADITSLRAVQAADGKVLWSARVAGTQALTLSDDRLVVVDKKKVVHSLSLTRGAEIWNYAASAHISQMVRFGDRLLATLYSGDLLSLDWKDGGNPAVIPLGEPYRLVRSADDRLIVCSASGTWEYARDDGAPAVEP